MTISFIIHHLLYRQLLWWKTKYSPKTEEIYLGVLLVLLQTSKALYLRWANQMIFSIPLKCLMVRLINLVTVSYKKKILTEYHLVVLFKCQEHLVFMVKLIVHTLILIWMSANIEMTLMVILKTSRINLNRISWWMVIINITCPLTRML